MSELQVTMIDGTKIYRISGHPSIVFSEPEYAFEWAAKNNITVKPLTGPEIVE